jgi:hypothetical protein
MPDLRLPPSVLRPPSSDLLEALTPFGRYGVELEASLAPHTSFRIGGPAAALLTINRLSHLEAALDTLHRQNTPFLLLGGGSNILISDAGAEVSGQIFGVRANEIYLYSQPRVIRSVHRSEGWTPESIAEHAIPAMKNSFYENIPSPQLTTWDPI